VEKQYRLLFLKGFLYIWLENLTFYRRMPSRFGLFCFVCFAARLRSCRLYAQGRFLEHKVRVDWHFAGAPELGPALWRVVIGTNRCEKCSARRAWCAVRHLDLFNCAYFGISAQHGFFNQPAFFTCSAPTELAERNRARNADSSGNTVRTCASVCECGGHIFIGARACSNESVGSL